MNVFLCYKTLMIRLDNIVVIIIQKAIGLPCQGRDKCLQFPQYDKTLEALLEVLFCLCPSSEYPTLLISWLTPTSADRLATKPTTSFE